MIISELSQIDINSDEGKYFMAALALITTTSRTDKTPFDVLEELTSLVKGMYPDFNDKAELAKPKSFEEELTHLVNSFSKENDSNTPDFILSEYLMKCLKAFNETSISREKWYGKSLSIN